MLWRGNDALTHIRFLKPPRGMSRCLNGKRRACSLTEPVRVAQRTTDSLVDCQSLQVAANMELWVERGIRYCKEVVHGHVSKDPEVTFANAILRGLALSKLRLERPDLCRQVLTLRTGSAYDEGEGQGEGLGPGSQLVGKGKKPPAASHGWLREMLCIAVKDLCPAGWPHEEGMCTAEIVDAALQGGFVLLYGMADVRGQDLVRTEASFRGGARQNHWVQVRWEDGHQREIPYVCAVQHLVRVQHPTDPLAAVLRVAGVRVYKPRPLDSGMLVAMGKEIDRELYPVALQSIDCKLVCACSKGDYKMGQMYFMPFFNISKTY